MCLFDYLILEVRSLSPPGGEREGEGGVRRFGSVIRGGGLGWAGHIVGVACYRIVSFNGEETMVFILCDLEIGVVDVT